MEKKNLRVVCILLPVSIDRVAFAEACLRWTPQIAIAEDAIFLEIGACRKLYSEHTFLLRMRVLLKRFGVEGRLSVAKDMATAKALGIFGQSRREDLPVEALKIYANPFRVSKSLDRVIALMKNLGLQKLGDVLSLPRRELASRFGKEALLALNAVEEAEQMLWPKFSPELKIKEKSLIDDYFLVRELEPLLFVIRGLIDRLLLRLRGQGRQLTALEIQLNLEKHSQVILASRNWVMEFSFPITSTPTLVAMVRDRLSFELSRSPLESSVIQVEVLVRNSLLSDGRQTDFFSKREEEQATFFEVVERLTQKLGADRAFMAQAVESYVPERSWRKVAAKSQSVQMNLPLRPLRILRRPQAMVRSDDFFICKKKRWQIVELLGPERLSGEWWMNDQERDYYRVKTDNDEELWVFTKVGEANYFLHGIFD